MADCDPLVQCVDLDGRILLQRTVYGPQFAFNADAGALASGAGLRPYLDLMLAISWRPLGLCQGPASSVMGLAPGEVVSVGIRTRQSRTFSSLVRDAAEASKTSSHSHRHTREQVPATPATGGGPAAGGGGGGGGVGGLAGDILGAAIPLAPIIIGLFGSRIADAMSVATSQKMETASRPSDVSKRMQQMIEQTVQTAASGPVLETASITDEILDTVMRSESESHLRETSVTTSQETETTIKRTFGNPYLDRSLQLRFIPVFNRFEVVTSFLKVVPGLVAHFAEPAATPGRLGMVANIRDAAVRASLTDVSARPVASALHATEAVGDDDATRRPMVQLLRTVSTRTEGVARPATLEGGLAWDRTEARGNGVHVPLAAPDSVVAAWGLRGPAARGMVESLERLAPDRLAAILAPRVRTVHVFAGTHVEAVPGTCVLPDIPADLKVIVPGATQYVRQLG
jgi:hypothetical protein